MSTLIPFVIKCPHCQDPILIEEINCAIFRHGVFKNTHQPIPPHASKVDCEEWKKKNEIYGCGKPFRLNSQRIPEICDYI